MDWIWSLQNASIGYVLAALFIILVIEGAGLPWVPYEPLFLATGLLISKGQLSLVVAVLVATAGNLVGNVIGYWLGKSPGRLAVERWGKVFGIRPDQLKKAQDWFNKYGGLAILIGRFFGITRTPTIIGAGILNMPFASYIMYSLIGSILWSLAWILGAQFVGNAALSYWNRYSNIAWPLFVVVTVVPIVVVATIGWWWPRLCRLVR